MVPAELAEEQINCYFNQNQKLLEQVNECQDDPLETLKVAMNKWDSCRKDARNLEIK